MKNGENLGVSGFRDFGGKMGEKREMWGPAVGGGGGERPAVGVVVVG
jgi:hypothetical protein